MHRIRYSSSANVCFEIRLGSWDSTSLPFCVYVLWKNCDVVISAITCYLLSQIYYFTGSTTYAGMGKELFGKPAEYIINLIQVLYGLGALFSYTIVAADESHYVMEQFLGPADSSSWEFWFVDRSRLLIIITIIAIIPPALLPRMDHLRFTSFVSIAAVAYLLVSVVPALSYYI